MLRSKENSESTLAIGVMSGTSLDGLDICLARFSNKTHGWNYQIIKAETIPYESELKNLLSNVAHSSGHELIKLHSNYGIWIAERINEFLSETKIHVDVIGSHGHTVFHNPSLGYSTQIGSGAHIASLTGIPCVCDFRMGDIARGGQGAPLVPIGDELLFNNYPICLNIGGIANLSFKKINHRLAYDICPANMALNYFSRELGFDFDKDGYIGRNGSVNHSLLEKLSKLDFYSIDGPKSLGREWFEGEFLSITKEFSISTNDLMRTLYEHIAIKISDAFSIYPNGDVLVTGGGAKNNFLIELIRSKSSNRIVIPENKLIDFKEALIFGLLAVLYVNQAPSSISSVTGAKRDSIAGCLYY